MTTSHQSNLAIQVELSSNNEDHFPQDFERTQTSYLREEENICPTALRITHSCDDQIRQKLQVVRALNNHILLVHKADASLSVLEEQLSKLQRQCSQGQTTPEKLNNFTTNYLQFFSTIDDILHAATTNRSNLLRGSSKLVLYIGHQNTTEALSIDLNELKTDLRALDLHAFAKRNPKHVFSSRLFLEALIKASQKLHARRSYLGAIQKRLDVQLEKNLMMEDNGSMLGSFEEAKQHIEKLRGNCTKDILSQSQAQKVPRQLFVLYR